MFLKRVIVIAALLSLLLPTQLYAVSPEEDLTMVELVSHFADIDRKQTNKIRFTADQGRFVIKIYNVRVPNKVRLLVKDTESGDVVIDSNQLSDSITHIVLPRDGTYDLYVEYLFNGDLFKKDPVYITLHGSNLIVPETDTPWLDIRAFLLFETIQRPFNLDIRSLSKPVDSVKVSLDGQIVSDANADTPVVINPQTLKDGFHRIEIVAKYLADTVNESVLVREFLVDRTDAYADVPKSHWIHHPVEVMNHLNILNGRDNQLYEPNAPISREEFAKIAALIMGLEVGEQPDRSFDDVPEKSWSRPYINALMEAGFVTGEEKDGKWLFHPKRTISKVEAVTIIGRTSEFAVMPFYGDEKVTTDFHEVPKWGQFSVIRLIKSGWISGYPDGTFHPRSPLTRAEAAKLLSHFIGL